ncbi:MAG TPA: NAD-dependent deacylase [bacterium (Candidatus Stahlbacteria)]|nr:NAD-dependent deacylase [Candidatus Stahlbacteria bacterium]
MRSAEIERFVGFLRDKRSVFVLTGAGISADSGIPTFRGQDGIWKNYQATDLATLSAFQRNPQIVWEWYHWRQSIILDAEPNEGHRALVHLEEYCPSFLILTQNVDGLQQKAGSKSVLELHGNIFRARCMDCGQTIHHELEPEIPKCVCGAMMRPDVVWFGEPVPTDVLQRSFAFIDSCDLVIVIGTSAVVQPAASLPVYGKNRGRQLVVVNREATPLSDLADLNLFGHAAEILSDIVRGLNG